MKILIDNSGYGLRNMGDVAMLQVALERLTALLPEAELLVLTEAPELLPAICPTAKAVDVKGRDLFIQRWSLLGGLHKFTPGVAKDWLGNLEDQLRFRWPDRTGKKIQQRLSRRGIECGSIQEFLELIKSCDAVIATGGGYITDTFVYQAQRAMGALILAQQMGKPTLLFGHGLGPLKNAELRRLAARALGAADLVSLREGKSGLELLKSLGVSRDHVIVTGDDAIELAYEQRRTNMGNKLGFNLRLADYAGVGGSEARKLGSALQNWASTKNAEVIGAPISLPPQDDDTAAAQVALDLSKDQTDALLKLDTPAKAAAQIGQCKLVVTGSYHAAIFALAQGIPVIGLAKSAYYVDKFNGVIDQFGDGCFIHQLNKQSAEELLSLTERVWNDADRYRAGLIEAAEKQIALSRNVFENAAKLLRARVGQKIEEREVALVG